MSIITEALKKAQKGQNPQAIGNNKVNKQPVFGPRAEYKKTEKKNFRGKKNNFLIGGVVFAALLIVSLALIFGYMQNMQAMFLKQSSSVVGEQKAGALPVNSQPIKPQDDKLPFKLSGIVQDENKPLAVINDIIVAAGETINDATVVNINDDSVGLKYKGKKITLYLAN